MAANNIGTDGSVHLLPGDELHVKDSYILP